MRAEREAQKPDKKTEDGEVGKPVSASIPPRGEAQIEGPQHLPPLYELIEGGKVLALNMPAGSNPALARAVGVMLKNAWLQALLMRPAKMKESPGVYFRPAVFICDEYQAFASVGEDDPSGDEKSFCAHAASRLNSEEYFLRFPMTHRLDHYGLFRCVRFIGVKSVVVDLRMDRQGGDLVLDGLPGWHLKQTAMFVLIMEAQNDFSVIEERWAIPSFVFIQLLTLLDPAKEQAQIKVVLVGPTHPRSTSFQFIKNTGNWLSFLYCFHHKNCQHLCNLNLDFRFGSLTGSAWRDALRAM